LREEAETGADGWNGADEIETEGYLLLLLAVIPSNIVPTLAKGTGDSQPD
jgi:hypothetical protein